MTELSQQLKKKIATGSKLFSVVSGSGLSAKQAEVAGADLIFVFNSAIYRQRGRSSLCGLLPYDNSNDLTFDVGTHEILSILRRTPAILGVCGTDPTIQLDKFLKKVQDSGFDGVCNYPTVALFDGEFGKMLEASPYCYEKEVEMLKKAKEQGLFTVAFAFNEDHAERMLAIGVDVLCIHLGLTKGGLIGAKKVLSLADGNRLINRILSLPKAESAIQMFFGGPVQTPEDLEYVYHNTACQGYIAGSSFDRIPSETSFVKTAEEFINVNKSEQDILMKQMLQGIHQHYDPVDFVKKYIKTSYMNPISLEDMAEIVHLSRAHLSTLFKKSVGVSFIDYLINYRMKKAAKLLVESELKIGEIASMVGYQDYAHFAKSFYKRMGMYPKKYRESNKNT